jgi:hypothetical protein
MDPSATPRAELEALDFCAQILFRAVEQWSQRECRCTAPNISKKHPAGIWE